MVSPLAVSLTLAPSPTCVVAMALTLEDPELLCRWVIGQKERRTAFERAQADTTPKRRECKAHRASNSEADPSLESNVNSNPNRRQRIGEEADNENDLEAASKSKGKKCKAKQRNGAATAGKKRPSTKTLKKKDSDNSLRFLRLLPARTNNKRQQGKFLHLESYFGQVLVI